MRAVFDTAARRWRHRILSRLPGCQHGRTGPQAGPAPAAGIYRAARWGGEAGLRAQCRETVAGPARRRPRSPPGLSISATICLPASRSLPPSKMPAATSSSPASQLRIRRLLNTCRAPSCKNIVRPSANAASAPPRLHPLGTDRHPPAARLLLIPTGHGALPQDGHGIRVRTPRRATSSTARPTCWSTARW